MSEILAQIYARHFTAGLVLRDDVVIEAAPIIAHMKRNRFNRDQVRDYCKGRGWKIVVVTQQQETPKP